jgi:hypothetical protein
LADKIENAIKVFVENGNRTKDISTSNEFINTSDVSSKLIEIMKNG